MLQEQQQPFQPNDSQHQQHSQNVPWIYDDIYNCFKIDKKTLIVRLNDNQKLYRKYQQIINDDNGGGGGGSGGDKENYYVCTSCAAASNNDTTVNGDEEYIYQSRAFRDDGLIYGESHAESCKPFSIEVHGERRTRLSTVVTEDTEWHYQNSFTEYEFSESVNKDNNNAPENLRVFLYENQSWLFIKNGKNEYKCENCLKYGWTTYAKYIDEKVLTQSHHPLCLLVEYL